jgi:hypothetical protein
MKRREFLTKTGYLAGLAALLGISKPDVAASELINEAAIEIPTTLVKGKPLFDSSELNRIVMDKFRKPMRNPLSFCERTPFVNYKDDSKILGDVKGHFFTADIIADDQEAVVYDTSGNFEFVVASIPSIKMGSRVGEVILAKEANRMHGKATENELKVLETWKDSCADTLVSGLKQRIELLLIAALTNSYKRDRYGIKMDMDFGLPKHLHHNLKREYTVLDTIKLMKRRSKKHKFDRITLGLPAFKRITQTPKFQKLVARKLNEEQRRDIEQVRNLLSDYLKMEIEFHDRTFAERANDGSRNVQRMFPDNKILLTCSAYDNTNKSIEFANAVVMESIVASITGDLSLTGGIQYGAIGYFTGTRDLNPPQITAWAVLRGFPKIKDKESFATLTLPNQLFPDISAWDEAKGFPRTHKG